MGIVHIDTSRAGGHLNLCFPEWQGYGEDNRVYHGAMSIRDQLEPGVSFRQIVVPAREDLEIEDGILGRSSIIRLLEQARELIARADPQSIFLVGGTCAAEIAPISFLNSKFGPKLGVLWLDAHGDLNTPESSPSKHFHGMPLRVLLGHGPHELLALAFSRLSPSQVVLVGARDLDPAEQRYVTENRVSLITPAALGDPGNLVEIVKAKRFESVYVHLDLDILDPAEFPHLLLPTAGGLSLPQLLASLGALRRQTRIVGSSIVEYAPAGRGDPRAIEQLVEVLRAAQ